MVRSQFTIIMATLSLDTATALSCCAHRFAIGLQRAVYPYNEYKVSHAAGEHG